MSKRINKYLVTYYLYMDRSREKTILVKANTERKAKIIAKSKIKKEFNLEDRHISIVSCELSDMVD